MRRRRFEARIQALEMARVLFGEPEGEGPARGDSGGKTAAEREILAGLRKRGEIVG